MPISVQYFENSLMNEATPISIPLSPLYTNMNEGFLYISTQEYPMGSLVVSASSIDLVANGKDYISLNIRTIDENGNTNSDLAKYEFNKMIEDNLDNIKRDIKTFEGIKLEEKILEPYIKSHEIEIKEQKYK